MEPTIVDLCKRLDEEPLFHMSLGSKELFHSNFVAWAVERYPAQMEEAFKPWLPPRTDPDAAGPAVAERERRHMDLVLRFPGRAPVVLENKMFSVPRMEQLNKYAELAATDPTLACCSFALLSPVVPQWSSGESLPNWQHIRYAELARRLTSITASITDLYVRETVTRYASLIESIDTILRQVAYIHDLNERWTIEPNVGKVLDSVHLADGCGKLRADHLRACLERKLHAQGISDQLHVSSGFTNKTPMVEAFRRFGPSNQDPKGYSAGWQLQGDRWRLAMIFPSLAGRTPEMRKAREMRARDFRAWLDFGPLERRLGLKPIPWESERFNRFDPDFVYLSRVVPSISIADVIDLGVEYARQLTVGGIPGGG